MGISSKKPVRGLGTRSLETHCLGGDRLFPKLLFARVLKKTLIDASKIHVPLVESRLVRMVYGLCNPFF